MMNRKQRKQLTLEPIPCRSPEIGRWLSALEDTRNRTRLAMEGIEAATLSIIDWVSPVSGNSIGMILYHLAAIEASWLYEEVLQEDFPSDIDALLPYDVRDGQDHLTSLKGFTLKDYWDRLGQIRTKLLIAYSDMTMEGFQRVRQLPDYDVTPAFVLHHLMQHEGEHRGQITELRLHAEQAIRAK